MAGEYFFDHPLSGEEIFWKIANGQVYQRPFTVREGETIFEIASELEQSKYMSASDFLQAAQNPLLVQDIAPGAKNSGGFSLPRHLQSGTPHHCGGVNRHDGAEIP